MEQQEPTIISNIEIVTGAFNIMKRDSMFLSSDNGSESTCESTCELFWNKNFNGLNGQNKEDFNRFYNLLYIDLSLINMKNNNKIMNNVFIDYNEFINKLRTKYEMKTKMACKMAFIMIIDLAISLYPI